MKGEVVDVMRQPHINRVVEERNDAVESPGEGLSKRERMEVGRIAQPPKINERLLYLNMVQQDAGRLGRQFKLVEIQHGNPTAGSPPDAVPAI